MEFDAAVLVDVGARRLLGQALDVSSSGMGLICASSVHVGRFVRLLVELPGSEGLLSLNGIVVRATEVVGGYSWGVQFVIRDQLTASALRSFVINRPLRAGFVDLPGLQMNSRAAEPSATSAMTGDD